MNDLVMKMGRTSLSPQGSVILTNLSVSVRYGGFDTDFENQIAISDDAETFSQPGDSGNLIVAENPTSGGNELRRLLCSSQEAGMTEGVEITITSPVEFVVREVGYAL